MNHLGFHFSATECNGWPKLKFFIDDDLYHDFEFTSESALVELPLDLLPGEHQICIELYEKNHSNTVVSDDTIIKDQLVTLESITVDNVLLPDFVKYQGVYCTGNVNHPQVLTWGQNGTWNLHFEDPIISWVLDLKGQTMADRVNDLDWATSTFHPKKLQAVRDDLNILEKILLDADT